MRFACFLLSLATVCFALIAPARAQVEVPITFRSGMIWLKVEVAGLSAPLDFLLDSGAGKSVIDLRAADRLGLKRGAREMVSGVQGRSAAYRIHDFAATTAGVTVPRDLLALDLRAVSAACGARIDGLLGADFFREHVVQIDFAAQKVRLFRKGESGGIAGEMLPLVRRGDALCVRASVNGNAPQWMRLDTGCNGALEWVVSGKNSPRSADTSVATTAGSRTHVPTEVQLGTHRIAAVKTGLHTRPIFPGEAGLIGNGLLSQFRVTVDAAAGELTLQRVAN